MILGIDNGVSGGIAAISSEGPLIAACPMPVQTARKGREVDVRTLWQWIDAEPCFACMPALTVILEEPGGSKSAKAATSMAGSFHAIRAILDLKRIRWHRVTPRAWQRVILPGCKAGDTKPRALEEARRLWPDESFLASDRCRVPHDGMIDAALLAEYGRRMKL